MSVIGLLGKAFTRPRNESPVPLTGRRGTTGSAFGSSAGTSTLDQLQAVGRNGTLYAIVDATSTAVAAVEWGLYRKPANGEPQTDDARVRVNVHAALSLWDTPNPYMTRHELVETVQQHIEATGLGFLIVAKAGDSPTSLPLELWYARPDRMAVVPHPTEFLTGWIYKSPDGDKIPLRVDEVIPIRKPSLLDPHGGSSPVSAIAADLDAAQYAAQYNRAFFENSAEPGGILSVEGSLTDPQFDELTRRWAEQHRGVARAHRVAVVEHGMTYTARQVSQRDMQFAELRATSRDVIMEPYRISKTVLGISDDVNLANAKAAEYQFAKNLTTPRLRRWHEALNHRLLPMFGATGKGVEFDFDSPVREDVEAENAERTNRAQAAATLVTAGFDRPASLQWAGLPVELAGEKADPKTELLVKIVTGAPSTAYFILPMLGYDLPEGVTGPGQQGRDPQPANRALPPVRNADDGPPDNDLSGHNADYEAALARLLDQWEHVGAAQRAELATQIAKAINDGDLAQLADLSVDSDLAATRLREALVAIHAKAAAQASAEAAAQGAEVPPAPADAAALGQIAEVTAALLAGQLAIAAGREALRRNDGTKTGEQVAAEVKTVLAAQSTAQVEQAVGGALAGTQNRARIATWRDGPIGSFYANEKLDKNTCVNCSAINGRFICTTEEFAIMDKLYTPLGGYIDCLGGIRCRGTVDGVWRPQTIDDPAATP